MKRLAFLSVLVCAALDLSAQTIDADSIEVDGVMRKMLVYKPSSSGAHPLIFAFHGRKGTMEHACARFQLHKYWPEAVVVYPQGLWNPLPSKVGPGWGWIRPDIDGNGRDIRFFDELLKYMKQKFDIDTSRIYSFGHSNGGSFTFSLWAFRGDVFAAVAPSSSPVGKRGFVRGKLTPKPCFMVAGEKDELVLYDTSMETFEFLKVLNGCRKAKALNPQTTYYRGRHGCDIGTYFHGGGHRYPTEASRYVVEFFKSHRKP